MRLLNVVCVLAAVVAGVLGLDDELVDHNLEAIVIEDWDRGREARQWLDNRNRLYMQEPIAAGSNLTCLSAKGLPGVCKEYKECYPYFKTFTLDVEDTWVMGSYDTCTYTTSKGNEVFGVCCLEEHPLPPPDDDEENEDNEEDNEFPFEPLVNEICGKRFYRDIIRIVNGKPARLHEFPFMAALMNRNRQFCGASLVDQRHLLTAAHCVAHMSKYDVQNLRVNLGDHNLKQSGETAAVVVPYKVKRVIRHKRFDPTTLHSDVAVLTLDRDVAFNEYVQPICLSTEVGKSYANTEVEVAGWGTTSDGGQQSNFLRKVGVRVWTNERCRSSYGSKAPGGITDHMMCASTPELGKDSCSGDSGGPLFICENRCVQVGIVSWGIGCARREYPGVYTRVTEMLPWIRKIVRKY